MKISDHADHTEELFGVRAEDIHKWIDGFFDQEGFDQFLRMGRSPDYDPYDHRKFRHCIEALDEAYEEFGEVYSREQIKNIIETHIKDDYNGYLPTRADFQNGTFTEKFHEQTHLFDQEKILSTEELSTYFKGKSYSQHRKTSPSFTDAFGFRIVLPTIIAMVLFIGSIFWVIVPVFEESMIDQKKQMIKELTTSAVSVVTHYADKARHGIMPKAVAQSRAIAELREMRYGDALKDYFFITDMHPKMIMHPYRQVLTGTDLSNYTDTENKSGKKLFVEFVHLVKNSNEGYLQYQWQWKDDSTKTVPKLSYVMGVPEWNWIVGTGVYINDVMEEIASLEETLLFTFAIISIGLLLIIIYVIVQSHAIENSRLKAELGLHEAKDRYRALVESSNEGYILEANGKTLYSNSTLKRLLGYSEEELISDSLWDTLFPVNAINIPIIKHLKDLFQNKAEPAEFEAQVTTRCGNSLDVIMSTSRIFFSEKHGHVISFRPITRKSYVGIGTTKTQLLDYTALQSSIVTEIQKSDGLGHVVESLNKMPDLIRTMIDTGSKPETLRQVIGSAYDAAINRCILLSINELGDPPVPFSFISLGSNARHEMTLFSDQDNAIIFQDPKGVEADQVRKYFLKLADRVCSKLNQAGYQFCPGGIMATNPKWCLSLSEWEKNFERWILSATAESILEVNVFFDIQCTYGDPILVDQLQEIIHTLTQENQQFFLHYAKNCLLYRPPLNVFGQLKAETRDGVKSINLKECLRPIEIFSRIYALKHGIKDANTIIRLQKLAAHSEIQSGSLKEMIYVFDHIWNLRFLNQIVEHTDLRKVNDILNIHDLTDLEQQNLRNVLSKVSLFQTKLSFDYFGTATL